MYCKSTLDESLNLVGLKANKYFMEVNPAHFTESAIDRDAKEQ
jgi:hypothetical protein